MGHAYRLERRLHAGTCSSVWLATQLPLDREVAVKFFRCADTEQEALDTLRREVSGLCRLRNPNNVQIVDTEGTIVGDSGEDGPFVVLEYVPGTTLRGELLKRRRLSPTRTWRIALQVLAGLSEAHAAGIVHRDIKPDNLMLWAPVGLVEHVKIIDYGLARRLLYSDPNVISLHGRAAGTPHYMAPEVVQGQPASPAADLYGLGVVMYECLAGQRPFDAQDPMALLYQQVHEAPKPLAELAPIPKALAELVHVALAKDPAERFPSALAFMAALQDLSWQQLVKYRHGEFAPIEYEEGVETDVFEPGGWEASVGLVHEPDESVPSHPYAPTHAGGATSTVLRSGEEPSVWVFTQDPALRDPVVTEALAACEDRYTVHLVDPDDRARTLDALSHGWTPAPWVMLFGDLNVLLQDPLIARLRGACAVSRLLLSTHLNADLLEMTVNFTGLDQHVILPTTVAALTAALDRMVERTRAIHHEQDQLRMALRDARSDLDRVARAAEAQQQIIHRLKGG